MPGPYAQKTAVIIGGTSGVGLATAALLQSRGARVLITGRSTRSLDDARSRLHDDAIVLRSDATAADDLETLAQHIDDELGWIDLLFINAGVNRSAPAMTTSPAMLDEVLEINTKAPFLAMQRLAPLTRNGGSIVLTTSVANVKGLPGTAAYAASKAALRSLTRTFARELIDRGIRVNAVSPGPIDTGILEKSLAADAVDDAKQQYITTNPMHRFGQPDEVAEAVAFLAFAATFTTGAEIPIDGGASQLV